MYSCLSSEAMGWVNVASLFEGATCKANHVKELYNSGWRYECNLAIDGNFLQHMAWAPGVIPAYMEVNAACQI